MFPSFEFAGRTFSPYFICILAGVVAVTLFLCFKPAKRGLAEYKAVILHVWGLVGVFIGMHLLYGLTMYEKLFALIKELGSIGSFSEFLSRSREVFGGSVFYGGLLGGLLAAAICYKAMRLTPDYADIGACSIPLFHFFGRLGCFFTGCCYGIECPVGFTYHYAAEEAANGVSRFPVQLLEACFELFLFVLLVSLFDRGRRRGRLLRLYLVLYPMFRFADEFLRGDRIRGSFLIFSTSQWISLAILLAVALYSVFARGKRPEGGEEGFDKKSA